MTLWLNLGRRGPLIGSRPMGQPVFGFRCSERGRSVEVSDLSVFFFFPTVMSHPEC